jgi:hypothetical protein
MVSKAWGGAFQRRGAEAQRRDFRFLICDFRFNDAVQSGKTNCGQGRPDPADCLTAGRAVFSCQRARMRAHKGTLIRAPWADGGPKQRSPYILIRIFHISFGFLHIVRFYKALSAKE